MPVGVSICDQKPKHTVPYSLVKNYTEYEYANPKLKNL